MKDILKKIKEIVFALDSYVDIAKRKKYDLVTSKKVGYDYDSVRHDKLRKDTIENISELEKLSKELESDGILNVYKINTLIIELSEVMKKYDRNKIDRYNEELSRIIKEIKTNLPVIKTTKPKKQKFEISSLPIPSEIRNDISADFSEVEKCYENKCYRASIIICGRLLETVLHRKYYEVTNNDILETNPGIGLGKLIAKLKEKEVFFDPGLMDQIHLINKVRIHSVHRKQEIFEPTKEHTQAMILYTYDIIKRMF